jgi:DNA-binding NtrC family response regulator
MGVFKGKILIVDDESEFRFSVSLILRGMGYETVEAVDGNEALEMILYDRKNGRSFDMLLIDIWMPGMSGVQLLSELNKREVSIPIIAVSGYGDEALYSKLLKRGCVDFIEKPFMPEDLLNKVGTVVGDKETK